MIVLIDNYDSFTYNIVQTLATAPPDAAPSWQAPAMKIFCNDKVILAENSASHHERIGLLVGSALLGREPRSDLLCGPPPRTVGSVQSGGLTVGYTAAGASPWLADSQVRFLISLDGERTWWQIEGERREEEEQ